MNSNTLERVYQEGRLIREEWSREEGGRQMLCLLTALAGDPNVRPHTCPAELAPPWLAHLLPWIDDAGTKDRWSEHIERLIPLAPLFGRMTLEQSRRCELRCKRVAVAQALPHDTASACQPVLDLIDRELGGEAPTEDEWSAAVARASGAAEASWSAEAAWAASAAWVASVASAAWAASAMWAAEAAWKATQAARKAPQAEADEMIADMLTALEEELQGARP